jgi:hypothetical protein
MNTHSPESVADHTARLMALADEVDFVETLDRAQHTIDRKRHQLRTQRQVRTDRPLHADREVIDETK